jgi:hypothetical protein
MSIDAARAIAETRAWVNHAVVGLNLCPFAKAVQVKERIRYVCSEATTEEALLSHLREELMLLQRADPAQVETTLLIHPEVLADFTDFNQFLGVVDASVEDLGLDGLLQVASFHPHYQFAGTRADDLGNATNRSPHPCLHLLREDSIERAVAAFAQPESIYENNMQTLQALGAQGWAQLQARCRREAGSNIDSEGLRDERRD